MTLARRSLIGTASAAALLPAGRARAQPAMIRLGVLSDLSGPYRDASGPLTLACVRQAADEFVQSGAPFAVEVLSADHQNKPDIGAGIVRQWIDGGGVDAIVDAGSSAVALAVQTIVRQKNKVFVAASATSALTNEQCSPNCVHWSFNTYMLAHSTCASTVAAGLDSWFLLTADYAFGHQMERDATAVIEHAGGRVLGTARYPFPETTDFSSFLLRAAASGAKVLALANAGGDTVNAIKQANEFGLPEKMRIAPLLLLIQYVRAIGIESAQGLLVSESFYWDLNDRTRAFAKRMAARSPDVKPNSGQAGSYGGTLHYLRTVAEMGTAAAKADGVATGNRMKAVPFDNDAFGSGMIRQDGRVMYDAHLFQVKKPAESTGPWDLYKWLATVPAEHAFTPLAEGHCPFVKI